MLKLKDSVCKFATLPGNLKLTQVFLFFKLGGRFRARLLCSLFPKAKTRPDDVNKNVPSQLQHTDLILSVGGFT